MNINSIINTEDDVSSVRTALINSKSVLQSAAYDYAHAALGAANDTLKGVMDSMPCGAVWPRMYEYQKFTQKAKGAIDAATQTTGMLLVAEESGNDYVDRLNADAKVNSMELHVVASLLEGASTRMTLALKGIPTEGAAGELCNPAAVNALSSGDKQ